MTSSRNDADNNTGSESPSALEKHIAWFANDEGWVSTRSVADKLGQLNDDYPRLHAGIIMFGGGIKVKSCPFRMFQPKEAVGSLNHSRNTGIYNLDGTINETQWQKLCGYSEDIGGTRIISQSQVNAFLDACRAVDERPDGWPHIDEKASNAEWSDFFAKCTDFWLQVEGGYEPAITLKRLRLFFENSPVVFNEVVEKILPVARPVI